MNAGTSFVVAGCMFTAVSGLVLTVTYSLLAPWWRSLVGRMMMAYAAALTLLAFLALLSLTLGLDAGLVRVVRGVLIFVVGLAMVVQTALIVQQQRKKRHGNMPRN